MHGDGGGGSSGLTVMIQFQVMLVLHCTCMETRDVDEKPVVLVEFTAVLQVGRLETSDVCFNLIRRRRFARVALDRTCHKPPYFYFLLKSVVIF